MRRAPLPRPPLAVRAIAALAVIKLALGLSVAAASPFGIHRDEFLYFSMGAHLRVWRMDFPPAIAILANVSRAVCGGSARAPTMEGTVLLVLAAVIARELDGGRWAQAITVLGVLCSPLFLRAGVLFQPVVLDQIWWTLALLALARIALARIARARAASRTPATDALRAAAAPAWVALGVSHWVWGYSPSSAFYSSQRVFWSGSY